MKFWIRFLVVEPIAFASLNIKVMKTKTKITAKILITFLLESIPVKTKIKISSPTQKRWDLLLLVAISFLVLLSSNLVLYNYYYHLKNKYVPMGS